MAVNFASASLRTNISCNKVSVDGLEVTNLISSDIQRRRAGFLAEAYVTPPVNITLSFPCPVNIHKIIVNGQVGSRKSIEFQLFTAISDGDTLSVDQFDRGIFHQVGRCFSPQKPLVCFTNARYKARDFHLATPATGPELETLGDGVTHEQLHHRLDKHLTHVRALTLSITRTADGLSAAVKKLEVWGQPAAGTSRDLLLQLKRDARSELESPASPSSSPLRELDSSSEPEAAGVPPEFLDAITCEVMSVPILLPCGVTVDRATLDRHIASEAGWGRPPSDPFTGRSFGDSHKPVVHSSLKARLDKFVTASSDRVAPLTGVVGSTGRSAGLSSSRLLDYTQRSPATSTEEKGQPSAMSDCARSVSHGSPSICGDETLAGKIGESKQTCQIVREKHVTRTYAPVVKRDTVRPGVHRLPVVVAGAVPSRPLASQKRAAETGVTDNNITERPAAKRPCGLTSAGDRQINSSRLQSLICSNCNRLESLYMLPCEHYACRKCLLHVKQCPVCDKAFRTCDPVRVHY